LPSSGQRSGERARSGRSVAPATSSIRGQIRTPARFQGGSHRGAGVAGLPSVAQQYRF